MRAARILPKAERSELHRTSRRIGALTAALLAAVLAVVSGLVLFVVIDAQRHQTYATLDQAIARTKAGRIEPRDGDDSAIRNVAVAVIGPHGLQVDGVMPTGLPDRAVMARVARTGELDQRRVVVAGRHYAIRTARRGTDTVQAVLDLREQRAEVTRLSGAIVISGAIGIVLVGLVGILLGRRAVRPLAEALALQQQFVADAAHELRTPLTLLSTRAQLLGRRLRQLDRLDPATKQDVDHAVRGLSGDADNLTEILEDLLLAADRTAGLPDLRVDLLAVGRDAVSAAEATALGAGIDVTFTAEPADAQQFRIAAGSRPALLRAATALIDNAISHARSRVEVTVASGPNEVALMVADDGPGIDAETLPRIFDRFASQRGSDSSRRHYGLGLALVSDVAMRHGGGVTVDSRPGGGAIFTVRLPTRSKSSTGRRQPEDPPRGTD